jgi:diguanylate cyclase (GGDEF)-like protein
LSVDRIPQEVGVEIVRAEVLDDHVATRALEDAGIAAAVFEALPDATAVLDRNGTITAANRAWRMFAEDNGGRPEDTGVGVNYLDVCTRAAQSGSADAIEVLSGLRAVLAGAKVESDREYPCDSPTAKRWFLSRVTAMNSPTGGAVASHVNITRRKLAELENQHQPLHDPLTGVTNQVLFRQRLDTELRRASTCLIRPDVGVIYLRVEGLAEVNDRLGPAAGDELLVVSAHRILLQLAHADTLARLGDERFAICATRTNPAHLTALADQIAAALAKPHRIHGQQVPGRASIGTYLAGPDDTVSHAMLAAEQTMYAVGHEQQSKISA